MYCRNVMGNYWLVTSYTGVRVMSKEKISIVTYVKMNMNVLHMQLAHEARELSEKRTSEPPSGTWPFLSVRGTW
jgi:hypothetical protein